MSPAKLGADEVYAFVMRGLLTEQSLETIGARRRKSTHLAQDEETARALSTSLLDEELVGRARRMAVVYTSIAAFENSVRDLVSSVLVDQSGEQWWTKCVSQKIQTKADNRRKEEERYKWHGQRGFDPLQYTDFGDLRAIIQQNWQLFEPHVQSVAWLENIFDTLERSRNVIMHSGELDETDIERIGIHIRDWVKQVG
jgi:hypothetical protein